VEADDRSYKGFNLFSDDDLKLFEVLARGEFNINGLQNKSLRKQLPSISSSTMTRILKRLHVHGIIRKVGKTYKYYVSKLGKAVITAGLTVRNMSVIPQLAHV
jgi:DNA-binding HxlR family transcriptional regulator